MNANTSRVRYPVFFRSLHTWVLLLLCCMLPNPDAEGADSAAARQKLMVSNSAIAQGLAAQGAEMLVDYGVEVYDLQVDVTNAGAIAFYKKHGFKTVKTLRKYYANGNDAFLMVKEF